MKNIPQNCQRCGAPITWDEVSTSISCEFCGSKTFFKHHSLKSASNSRNNLNHYRRILFNKKTLIVFIAAIPITLYTISKTNNQFFLEITSKFTPRSTSSQSQNYELISTYQASGDLKLRKKRDYEGAIKDYSKIIKIDPSYMMGYYLRGSAKSLKEDYQGAIKDLSKAIKIDPGHHLSYNSRAFAKQYIKKDYRGALADLFISIGIEPNLAQTNHSIGLNKYKLKEYEGAIKYLKRAINLDPKSHQSYFYLGEIKYKWEDYPSAIKYHSKAIKIDPTIIASYIRIGESKIQLSDKNGACITWKKGLVFAKGSILEKTFVKMLNQKCRN